MIFRRFDSMFRNALRSLPGILFLLVAPALATAAAPTLTHVYPAGGQRGTKVDVTLSGKFSWPVSIWAPGVEIEPQSDSGKLKIAIPPDLAADRIWIRVHNEEGVSAAVPFLIGSIPELDEKEPNNAPKTALALLPGGWAINGTLKGVDVDCFAIPLTAGQTLVAVLEANSALNSPMDSILQVVSPDGIVAAENNDDVGLDPRLTYTAKKSGTYLVRLFAFSSTPDTAITFRGGQEFIYRLTVSTGPYITHTAPLAASLFEPGAVEVQGWNIEPGTKLPVVPFGSKSHPMPAEFDAVADLRSTHDAQLGMVFAPGIAGSARVRLVPHAVIPGIAKSDEKNPLALTLPVSLTGWMKAPRQIDRYRFPLRKGEQLVVLVETRNLQFSFDPLIRLIDPTGAVAAEFDDATPKLASFVTHTAAHDGDYQLTVADRARRGGERGYYRLTAKLEEPDFELFTAADSIVVAPDKASEFPLNILRRASASASVGPITIEAVDLPSGITAQPVVSEPGTPTGDKVSLKFSTSGAAVSGPIRIVGTAKQPREIRRNARTSARLGNTLEVFWLTGLPKK